jgi:signal transduction histidine kinase
MESSIQAFLDFARPPALEKRLSKLRPIIDSALDLLAGKAAEQDIQLQAHYADDDCELDLDATQIKQVVLNLVLNAMDELGPRGKIEIDVVSGGSLSDSHAASGVAEREGVRIIVADNGPGIPDELLPKIFEPFVTRKELGTGLGLTICRRIIEAHGGEITAANSSFGGAEFCIWLPKTVALAGSSAGETKEQA